MADRTGIARGSLRPVIYFINAAGNILLPPEEIGNPGYARMVYEKRYKDQGYEWREAGTLAEVDTLQNRLIEQETRRNTAMADEVGKKREECFKRTGETLRARMISADTSEYERDFIRAYLQLRNEKRDKYRDALTHRNYYIYAREQDEAKKVEDLMPLQPGQFERSGV